MGIKDLNRYLSDRCSKRAISKRSLSVFRNKTIVIDTSIYLYKYASHDSLIPSFQQMIQLFQSHHINPIFVFDGKAPAEKRGLLRERSRLKKEAEKEYDKLQNVLLDASANISLDDKQLLEKKMDELKGQMVRIKPQDILSVKTLFDEKHIQYEEAVGEADQLCASMVYNNKAWACMSDDMDMFVYGCPRILRHLSMHNKTVLYYEFDRILDELQMDEKEFREIMVVSGTDYNYHDTRNDTKNDRRPTTNLKETLRWYFEYKHQCRKNNEEIGFYDWLVKYTKYITDLSSLQKIHSMFCIAGVDTA